MKWTPALVLVTLLPACGAVSPDPHFAVEEAALSSMKVIDNSTLTFGLGTFGVLQSTATIHDNCPSSAVRDPSTGMHYGCFNFTPSAQLAQMLGQLGHSDVLTALSSPMEVQPFSQDLGVIDGVPVGTVTATIETATLALSSTTLSLRGPNGMPGSQLCPPAPAPELVVDTSLFLALHIDNWLATPNITLSNVAAHFVVQWDPVAQHVVVAGLSLDLSHRVVSGCGLLDWCNGMVSGAIPAVIDPDSTDGGAASLGKSLRDAINTKLKDSRVTNGFVSGLAAWAAYSGHDSTLAWAADARTIALTPNCSLTFSAASSPAGCKATALTTVNGTAVCPTTVDLSCAAPQGSYFLERQAADGTWAVTPSGGQPPATYRGCTTGDIPGVTLCSQAFTATLPSLPGCGLAAGQGGAGGSSGSNNPCAAYPLGRCPIQTLPCGMGGVCTKM
jgi:hypothetical protein